MFNNFIFVLASCNVILVHSVDNVYGFFLFTESMIIKYTFTCFTFKINIIIVLISPLIQH